MAKNDPSTRLRFQVDTQDEGIRLDVLVRRRDPTLGRKVLSELFALGRVLVDGRKGRKGTAAKAGSWLEVDLLNLPGRAEADPNVPFSVEWESADLIVVDKPAGLPSTSVIAGDARNLAAGLLARFPEMAKVERVPGEAGLIHRLDTFTSGLLVAARSAQAYAHLRRELSEGRLAKKYLAIAPEPPSGSGIIDLPLGPDPKSAQRVSPRLEREAAPRRTSYRVIERRAGWSLLELELARGYRHQIRAHLAHLGCPLLGDVLYGGQASEHLARHALHASYVAGTAPGGEAFEVRSALPDDLRAAWDELPGRP